MWYEPCVQHLTEEVTPVTTEKCSCGSTTCSKNNFCYTDPSEGELSCHVSAYEGGNRFVFCFCSLSKYFQQTDPFLNSRKQTFLGRNTIFLAVQALVFVVLVSLSFIFTPKCFFVLFFQSYSFLNYCGQKKTKETKVL